MFVTDDSKAKKILDEDRLVLFASYCCQSEKEKGALIADHIKQKTKSATDTIDRKAAEETLTSIIDIASTLMLKSVI